MFSTKTKWIKIADNKEELNSILKGRTNTIMLIKGERKILVTHQNNFYLTSDTCPHQGAKLNNASCKDGKIICPWHHYAFDLKTGRGNGLHLTNHIIEIRNNGVFAGYEYFSWFGE